MERTFSQAPPPGSISVLQVPILRFPEVEGGVDLMIRTLCDALRSNCRVSVLLPGQWAEGATCNKSDYQGIPVYRMRLRTPWDPSRPLMGLLGWLYEIPRTIMTLRKIVREEGVDVIHLHMAKDFHYLFRILRWLGGPPYIMTLHGGEVVNFYQQPKHCQKLMRWSLRGAAKVVAVSKWLVEEGKARFPEISISKAVYNGLDIRRLDSLRSDQANEQIVPAIDCPFFVMVGSFDPYKGHDIAIRAWPEVVASCPGLKLVLIGMGNLEDEYHKLVQELGCEDDILFVGQLAHESVIKFIRYATGMLFPSRSEGFGLVALEAGYVKIPVVVARVGPLPEIVCNEIDGLVFEPEDSAGLAEAVKRLMRDKALRSRLAESLNTRLLEHFTAERMAGEYIKAYKEIVRGKSVIRYSRF